MSLTNDESPGGKSAMLTRYWWAFALRGVIAVFFGVVALWVPVATMLSLALLFSAYLLVDGVLGLVASVRAAGAHGHWGVLLAEAVLSLIMGVIAFFFPGAAILAFVLITAGWALISGGLMLWAAFGLHIDHGRWWLALGGVVSIVWGLVLVAAPMIGALVLTWWLGAYAILFGIALLLTALRLWRGKDIRES